MAKSNCYHKTRQSFFGDSIHQHDPGGDCSGLGIKAARLLGPAGRGELAAIETWPAFLAVVGGIGISEALVYFSARKPDRAGEWLSTLNSNDFGCLYSIYPDWLSIHACSLPSQSDEIVITSRQYLWYLPIMAVVGMLPHPLRGRDDLVVWNFVRILPSLVWVCILIACSIQLIDDPVAVAYFYLIGLALLILPTGWIVLRRLPGSYKPSTGYLSPMLKYGIPSMLSTLPYNLNLKLDKMIMVGFLGPNSLGLYVVAVAWSGAIIPLITAMPMVMVPRVVARVKNKNKTVYWLNQPGWDFSYRSFVPFCLQPSRRLFSPSSLAMPMHQPFHRRSSCVLLRVSWG